MKGAPPHYRPPLWATREFRWLVIAVTLGVSAVAVLIFEIAPVMRARSRQAPKTGSPDAAPSAGLDADSVRFDGILEKVKDSTPISAWDEPYLHLVRSLARADARSLARDAKSLAYGQFARIPAQLRGRTVRVMALFLHSDPLRPEVDAPPVEWIHRTYLSDLTGDEGYVVDLLEPPPSTIERRALVAADAVFVKLGTYEGKKGPVQAPHFVAKGLRVVEEKGGSSPVGIGGVIGGAAAVVVALLLTVILWQKSRTRPAFVPATRISREKP